MRITNPTPYPGQRYWTTQDAHRIEMMITAINNNWVHYTNTNTKQTYNCTLPAFLQRFTPILD